MKEVVYVGEHLLPGKIGHALILLGFVASLLAAFSYFFATNAQRNQSEDLSNSWKTLARTAFGVHSASIIGVILTIFYIMSQKYYEYVYAWEHTSDDLPFKYIFSAFWEGQEGSFLLWMFWHIVLGIVLIFSARKWESPALFTISIVQAIITSMILGLYFVSDDFKIGSNPLLLLRDTNEAPIFSRSDYLQLIEGNGLNPLLQNYWMTIHPPTLFLGFASTIVPFAFAVAALWTREYEAAIKPMLAWSLFSTAVLGTGILMGGAWAYEALSFGGYWAWDPVENASLVPWLVLIAALHTLLVARNTGHSLRPAFLFAILTFSLIVYSTFLTRSGILGETSVHAFTEMGLEAQLTIFLVLSTLPPLVLLALRWRNIPKPEKEESAYSREFWMFIGSLVLIFSSILISFTTSIPVFNKIAIAVYPSFKALSPPVNAVEHYNKYQLWIAVLIGLFSSIAQFFRYRALNMNKYWRTVSFHLGIAALIASAMTFVGLYNLQMTAWQYAVLLWASVFSIVVNADYFITVLRGKINVSAAALSHVGFGIMIIGTLVSGLNKNIISKGFMSASAIEGFDEKEAGNNLLLYKGLETPMGEYAVTYLRDSVDGLNRYFEINYKRYDAKKNIVEDFNLNPNIIYDKQSGQIAASNPSTKHYLHRDIFTHVSALPRSEVAPETGALQEDTLTYNTYSFLQGDTTYTSKYYVIFQEMTYEPKNNAYKAQTGDKAVGAKLLFKSLDSPKEYIATPIILLRNGKQFLIYDEIPALQVKMRFNTAFDDNEEDLDYREYEVRKGESVKVGNYTLVLQDFSKEIENADYEPQAEDLAVQANIVVKRADGDAHTLKPVYLIRNKEQLNIADDYRAWALKVRFLTIDPSTEKVTLRVAANLPQKEKTLVDIAENVPRSDWIVMQAIVFPWINLFWLGSIMLMLGLGMGAFQRFRQ